MYKSIRVLKKYIHFPMISLVVLTLLGWTTLKPDDTATIPTIEYKKTIYQQWHTVQLQFEGPTVAEDSDDNPFLNYFLQVEFTNSETKKIVRGFFAADGNAAETSSTRGNKWQVRFSPDKLGEWSYKAYLYHKDSIGVYEDIANAEEINLKKASGSFQIVKSDKKYPDFRKQGRIIASNGTFKFENSDTYWLKFGANSPENLLAFSDFDGTYRTEASKDDGEASTNDKIHHYKAHMADWQPGDPTWKNGKGKGIIGALNYLAAKDMNAVYFLTMNIMGDGKDVWPYTSPEELDRFDVSKLEQWEIVFRHMQSKGLLMHLVLQETENETLLDDGETAALRKLYLNELMARFGHHLGLIWNLGEENGPAEWSPIGQNDQQRKDMAAYIKEKDVYNHPLLLHTHAEDPLRSEILDSIVGFKAVDGLSLQQAERENVSEIIEHWKKISSDKGNSWVITMDEIGKWFQGALTDKEDPTHETLRKHVLWGSLLSGGAGVEWYFGAKHPHNDLNSEDWRQRERLWQITAHAKSFFENYLPYWKMQPAHQLLKGSDGFCLREKNQVYALYVAITENAEVDLSEATGKFKVGWFDPLNGGKLQKGSVGQIKGGQKSKLGLPPKTNGDSHSDWVCLLRKIE